MVVLLILVALALLVFAFWPSPRFVDSLRRHRARRAELELQRPDQSEGF